jgi:hypothetical protein
MGIRLIGLVLLFLIPALSFSKDLGLLSWGMKNRGEPQRFLTDHYTYGVIDGLAGEDIHPLPPEQAARKPVIVAVLDTGIDESHPSFSGALIRPGFNAIDGSTNVKDTHGHGTHVSGIIAARRGIEGFAGVSAAAMILPIRVIQSGPNAPIRPQDLSAAEGTALTENVARGMIHAMERGARIIHLSLAWPATIRSKSVDDALALAKSRDVLVVSSAGNDSTGALVQPCIDDHVVCVAAHGPDGAFTRFSNDGPMVDLLAPGISILSTWPLFKTAANFAGQTGFEIRSGTSMAAPFVTGALAELLSLGYSPKEAVNRILLSTRPTQALSRFRPEVQLPSPSAGETPGVRPPVKAVRFGNLDLGAAVRLKETSFLVPEKKAPIAVLWNGKENEKTIAIGFVNRWAEARDVEIRTGGKSFHFDRIRPGERIEVQVGLRLFFLQESSISIPVRIRAKDAPDRNYSIPVSMTRILSENSIPGNAITRSFPGFSPDESMSIRSVIPVAPLTTQAHLFLKDVAGGLSVTRAGESGWTGPVFLKDLASSRLLNWYALPDGTERAIFSAERNNDPRPSFVILELDSRMRVSGRMLMDSETVMLPENFKFIRKNGRFTPHFISRGFTPKADLPPYDPWNPEWRDRKRLRLYRLDETGPRLIRMDDRLTPLFLLPDDRVLATSGEGYSQSYSLLKIRDGETIDSSPLDLPSFRMLAGLAESGSPVSLDGSLDSPVFVSGRSSPGNLRVSEIHPVAGQSDRILERPDPLDSLMSLSGVFSKNGVRSFLAESHFDLVFYPGDGQRPFATSLHRYSYIPSMIFSKGFFPGAVQTDTGALLPGVYLPANPANDETSEIWLADPGAGAFLHPLGLRIKAAGNCRAVGNLARGTDKAPAMMTFWCGNLKVDVPVTTRE